MHRPKKCFNIIPRKCHILCTKRSYYGVTSFVDSRIYEKMLTKSILWTNLQIQVNNVSFDQSSFETSRVLPFEPTLDPQVKKPCIMDPFVDTRTCWLCQTLWLAWFGTIFIWNVGISEFENKEFCFALLSQYFVQNYFHWRR